MSSPKPPVTSSAAPPTTGSTPVTTADKAVVAAPVSWGSFLFGLLAVFFIPILFALLFSYGAAKLSFDHNGSFGWALLDFIFPMFYYPYYAIFVSKPTVVAGGGLVSAVFKGGRKLVGRR